MTRAIAAFAALCGLVFLTVARWAALPAFAPLTGTERAAVMHRLRGEPDPQPLDRVLPDGGPVVVTRWDRGAPVARAEGRGRTLGAAVDAARHALAPGPGRIKVDVVLARAPLLIAPAVLASVGVVPGVDGVGMMVDGREQLLLADDLLREDLASAHAPLPGMDFTLGLDVRGVKAHLAAASGADVRRARWFRFRSDGFVEPARPGAPLPVLRGNTPGPPLTRETLVRAAVAGGDYLARHLRSDGQFDYEYWTARDQSNTGGYSIPRHAGATWYLAALYNATGQRRFLDAALRAERWLALAHPPGCDCIGDPGAGKVDLGSTALALVALGELQRAQPDPERAAWMARLTAWVHAMQKPDGDFAHLYNVHTRTRDEHTKLLYYSGEAAFALARLGDSESLDRALVALTDHQYRSFALRFYFMEDHWTCMAVDAGWDHLPPAHRERYARFCDQFVEFLGRTQFHAGDAVVTAQPDFDGAYGFSPLLPPHGTPVGSRTETTLSTFALQQRRGLPTEVTRRQIEDGLRFLLAHQIDDDAAYLMADPAAARGGFLMSDVARYVRIDFIQHACSALLRASSVL